jgi:Photosynthetic reaction centre cytochrome C subunit
MRRFTVPVMSVFVVLLTLPTFAQAPAPPRRRPQLPDKFTNLQVLPKDISKDKLVDTMRLFSRSLGVHCDHCHEATEDHADWASDKKDAKNAARTMMKMVNDINTNFMPKTEPLPGEEKEDAKHVNCWTCHRGQKEPAEGPPAEEHREGPQQPQEREHEDERPH